MPTYSFCCGTEALPANCHSDVKLSDLVKNWVQIIPMRFLKPIYCSKLFAVIELFKSKIFFKKPVFKM